MATDLKPFLQIIAIMTILFLHPCLVVVQVLFWNLGVWNWIVIALSLTPYLAAYIVVKKKQDMNYLDLLLAQPREWNTEKSLEEYLKLIQK